jgi:Glucose / Sorbosone dehydrogenase
MVGIGGQRGWTSLVVAAIAALVITLVLLGGRASGRAPHLALRDVGAFSVPIYITHAPGAPGMLYVVEQSGQIRVVDHGTVRSTAMLNISGRISYGGERGLLSMAFDPHFPQNHLLYVDYTNADGNLEVDEFHATSNVSANPNSRRKVLIVPHPGESNHNGGQLQFGPDGDLYISTGDGGGAGDNHDNARHLGDLLGKILRISPHKQGLHPYTVPPTNPYVGRAGRDEIYSYGLRNPFRFSFDSANGNLAIGDVGQGTWEEVDYVTGARAKGSYFGWPTYEGYAPFDLSRPDPNPNHRSRVQPIIVKNHGTTGFCAIIGGFVVHNPRLSLLDGRYVYSDNCKGDIRSLVPTTPQASNDSNTGLSIASPTSFGVGGAGQLYVASGNYGGDGHVYQIVQQP